MIKWGLNERGRKIQTSKNAFIPPQSVIPASFEVASNDEGWEFQWRGHHSNYISFNLRSMLTLRSLMNDHEWRDDSEMRGYFRIKAEPLILKSFSFLDQSVIPSQNLIVHAIISFISGSFGHSDVIPKWLYSGCGLSLMMSLLLEMMLDWTEWGKNTIIGCCLL